MGQILKWKNNQMAKIIISFCLLLLVSCGGGGSSVTTTTSDNYYGLTFLGLRSQTTVCSQVFEMLDGVERFAVSLLWNSFGESDECLLSLLQDPRPKSIQVFLVNAVCLRKNNCAGVDAEGYDLVIDRAMDAYDTIIPFISMHDTLIITPALEDDLDVLDYKYIADEIRFYAPEAKIGRNKHGLQISAADCADADYCELHNEAELNGSATFQWSNDGYDLSLGGDTWSLPYQYTREDVLGRVTNRLQGARTVYLWKASFNGLLADSAGSLPPIDRYIAVSKHDREQVNNLLKEIEDVH